MVPLPFELQVLETCMGDICALATQLSKELEGFANPALDALTHGVCPHHAFELIDLPWQGCVEQSGRKDRGSMRRVAQA